MDFIAGVYYYLKQVEFILTKGYTEKSNPLSGHLFNDTFDPYRVRINEQGNQVTCVTCEHQSSSCKKKCQLITLAEEARMWKEFRCREAESEIAGSAEATQSVDHRRR